MIELREAAPPRAGFAARAARAFVAHPERAALAMTVLWSALSFTTLSSRALAQLSVLAAVTFLLAPPAPLPARARLLLRLAVALVCYTALQLAPLPMDALRVLSPHAASVWEGAYEVVGAAPPRWAPLSLEPSATRVELLRGTTYVLTLLAALRISATRSGAAFAASVVPATSIALLLVTFAHQAIGAGRIYGVWTVYQDLWYWRSPLVNPNLLAAQLELGACLALGVATERGRRASAIAGAVLGCGLVVATLATGARGAMLGLAVAGFVAGVRRWRRAPRAIAIVCCCAMVALTAATAWSNTWEQVNDRDFTKLEFALAAGPMLSAYAIAGAGRGAFGSAYRAFEPPGPLVWTHPENVLLQLCVEWGWLVGAAALLGFAWILRPTRGTPLAATSALVACAVHAFVNYHTESPGVMVSAIVCAALAVRERGRVTGESAPRAATRPKSAAGARSALETGGVAVSLALAAVVFLRERDERWPEIDRVRRALSTWTRGAGALEARLRGDLARFPAEPYFAHVYAHIALRSGLDPRRWTARALTLAPKHGEPHLENAAFLAGREPAAAVLELRAAMDRSPGLARDAARAFADVRGPLLLLLPSALPKSDDTRRTFLPALSALLFATHPATSHRAAELAAAQDDVWARRLLAESTAADLGPDGWCSAASASCRAAALAAAEAYVRVAPRDCAAQRRRAELWADDGPVERATAALVEAAKNALDPDTCLAAAAALADQRGRPELAIAALARWEAIGCADPRRCIDVLVTIADIHRQRGRRREGLHQLQNAFARAPQRRDVEAKLAAAAAAEGLYTLATMHYMHLAAVDPQNGYWMAQVSALRDAGDKGRRR